MRKQSTQDTAMHEQLNEYEQKIFELLAKRGATLTGDVAENVRPLFGTNKRQHSGAVKSWLVDLEKKGLVRRLDEEKPVCWARIIN
jgi:hypothetical protein